MYYHILCLSVTMTITMTNPMSCNSYGLDLEEIRDFLELSESQISHPKYTLQIGYLVNTGLRTGLIVIPRTATEICRLCLAAPVQSVLCRMSQKNESVDVHASSRMLKLVFNIPYLST